MTKASPTVGAQRPHETSAPPLYRRRGGHKPLGTFAFEVMKAIMELGPKKSYGLNINEHLMNKLRAIVDLAQVYVTLRRLKEQGFLKSKVVPAPSGKRHMVVLYKITKAGAEALAASRAFYNQLADETPAKGETTHVETETVAPPRRSPTTRRTRARGT